VGKCGEFLENMKNTIKFFEKEKTKEKNKNACRVFLKLRVKRGLIKPLISLLLNLNLISS